MNLRLFGKSIGHRAEPLHLSSRIHLCNDDLLQLARPGKSQPIATVLGILQGSIGKGVELHLRSGEKMGGKVAQVMDNVVHLSNLAGAEYFDAFVDAKGISAVVVRVAGR